jgi:hypothetical protein
MRKIYALTACLLMSICSNACDVCGCAAGGSYFGILPMHQRHFLGTRYQYRSFKTQHIANDPNASIEQFHTFDLWGRFYPNPDWQIFGFVPYHFFEQNQNDNSLKNNGLGDITIITYYALLNTGDSIRHRFRHNLYVGGGLKMPTGQSFLKEANGTSIHPNLQLGSGSWDFIISTNYTFRFGNQGFFTDLNARYNTANTNDYRFGHRLNATLKYFHWWELREGVVLPNIGTYSEWIGQDLEYKTRLGENAGMIHFASIGLDFYYKRLSINGLYQIPMIQKIGTGLVQAQHKWSLNFSFLF